MDDVTGTINVQQMARDFEMFVRLFQIKASESLKKS